MEIRDGGQVVNMAPDGRLTLRPLAAADRDKLLEATRSQTAAQSPEPADEQESLAAASDIDPVDTDPGRGGAEMAAMDSTPIAGASELSTASASSAPGAAMSTGADSPGNLDSNTPARVHRRTCRGPGGDRE